MLTLTISSMPEDSAEGQSAEISRHYDTRLPQYPWHRRVQIPFIAAAVTGVIRTLGPTLRFETVGLNECSLALQRGEVMISAFWHRCIIPATWFWRNRGIVVMNTTNFDGQWTRRVIEHFGFGTAQGSSTRGGLRGLAVMAGRLEEGYSTAFTIDGPRGPRYIAKPGPVMLARRTGKAIFLFHIGLESAYTLKKAWDLMQIPHPFSRAVLVAAPLIQVSAEADAAELQRKHTEMQKALERVRDIAESWFTSRQHEREQIRAEWGR